jgi:N-succinyldiaminopimelate aminotransferase
MDAARAAIANGRNQYAPGRGVPALLQAIAAHQARFYGSVLIPTARS